MYDPQTSSTLTELTRIGRHPICHFRFLVVALAKYIIPTLLYLACLLHRWITRRQSRCQPVHHDRIGKPTQTTLRRMDVS